MSEHITSECLTLANKLLSASGLSQSTKLQDINELDRDFFKDLFATVFGQILPDESAAVFFRALLNSLSDILSISLDHIDPIAVAKRDAVALYHLIELCLTYVQHLVDSDTSKGADILDGEQSHNNSTDTEALLKLANETKYLKHPVKPDATWQNVLQPYLKHQSQVDVGGMKRSQSSHHLQRGKKHSRGKPLEEYLQEEFPAADVSLNQNQSRYIVSNFGFYHTQRRLIQKQLNELEKQRTGILKAKKSELEHWNRREDENDAVDVRIKTRAALRDERMTRAKHRRMLKEEERQRQKMLLATNEDLVFRRTVHHILKLQREKLVEKKKERVQDFQENMRNALGDLEQLNRNYQEKISKITREIMEKQKKDEGQQQLNWKERRRRLIKNIENTRKEMVRGAREAHFRKKDEERVRKDIDKAAFNFEVHDTDE